VKKLVGFAVVAGAVLLPSAALASGGAAIATAPLVAYGQQEFGNTATDDPGGSCNWNAVLTEGFSWWQLPVTAGDRVTIDYQAEFQNFGSLDETVYPVGTSDFDFAQTDPIDQTNDSGDGVHGQDVFTARQSGVMPLLFDNTDCVDGGGGPYNFTTYVQHAIVLSQRHWSNRRSHTTYITLTVRNPDGAPIDSSSLRARYTLNGLSVTHAVGTGAHVIWSRHQRNTWQTIRVTVFGPSYQTTSLNIRLRGV
jgi:hypothetical protein